MRKRIAYSQNFLKDKGLVANIVRLSSITKEDVVYDIGAGQGIITDELVKVGGKVVAFEIDKNLYEKLSQRLKNEKAVEVKLGNFLEQPLPNYSYKVFSNIPFNITASVIKKLTETPNPPLDTYLIVQNEAAKKFVGKPLDNKNSQLATLLKPWFEITIVYKFERSDFFPKPMVDVVLMRIKKRDNTLINREIKGLYNDFVTFTYNQFKPNVVEGLAQVLGNENMTKLARQIGFNPNSKPSELDFTAWQAIFSYFLNHSDNTQKKIVAGSYAKLLKQQEGLQKINRTRVDKNWKAKSPRH